MYQVTSKQQSDDVFLILAETESRTEAIGKARDLVDGTPNGNTVYVFGAAVGSFRPLVAIVRSIVSTHYTGPMVENY